MVFEICFGEVLLESEVLRGSEGVGMWLLSAHPCKKPFNLTVSKLVFLKQSFG